MPEQDHLDSMQFVDNKQAIVCSFHQLPKLVYVSFSRRDEDQEDWRTTNHHGKYLLIDGISDPDEIDVLMNEQYADRFTMLNARAGGIPRKDVVMPIDLIYDDIEKVSISRTLPLHNLHR